jgi:geranylgeranyl reductase family protein
LNSHNAPEILIAGAGPGGAITAIALAKANIPVYLVDKETFPRDKICGDALSGKVVEVLKKLDPEILTRLNAAPLKVGSWGVDFFAPNRKKLHVPFRLEYNTQQDAPGYIATRLDFDQFLIEEVRKYDLITFLEGHEADNLIRQGDKYQVTFKNKSFAPEVKLLIAADGAHSVFAKKLAGITVEKEHYCGGLRAYYQGVTGMDADNFIELHFINDVLPGYFWIFPLPDGKANVGIGMRSDKISSKKIDLKKVLKRIIAEDPHIAPRFKNATLIQDIKGYGLPLGSKKRNISGDGFMLIGDAASLIDPFTGEGIGNAMMSGWIAAQTAQNLISQNIPCSAQNLKAYDQAVYNRLWSELRLSKVMQEMVNFPWLFNMVVNKANRNEELRSTISCMFEDLDMRQKLKSPKFYFNLLFADDKK